ncbi:MAG: RsmF rRNA methyltransferase first C-terminal domain-containing protein [Oscillospiraceae bacterium]
MNDNYFELRQHSLLKENYEKLFTASQNVAFRGVTVNTRLLSCSDFFKLVPFHIKPSGFAPNSFCVLDENVKLGVLPLYHAGAYYVQEPSASSAASVLNIEKDDLVLDLCAAPGGKSAQLAAKLNGSGLLFCNEFVKSRSQILLSNMERMAAENVVILNEEPRRLSQKLPEFFDKILVDAPCSGEGMFRKEPQAVAQHSEALVKSCAALQIEILDAAAAMLKNGGEMVYSTCTFSPNEDESNVKLFLDNHKDFSLISTNAYFGCGGHKSFCINGDFDTSLVTRIYPCHGGEGHFIAKFKKNGDIQKYDAGSVKGDIKPKEYSEFIKKYFPTLENREIRVSNGNILILPKFSFPRLNGLNVLRAGVAAGSIEKGRFMPHHALFKEFGTECVNIL